MYNIYYAQIHTHTHTLTFAHAHTRLCTDTHARKGQRHTRCSLKKWDRNERELWRGRELSVHTEYEREGKARWEWAGGARSISKSKQGGGANKPSGSAFSLWTACFRGQQKIS